MDQKLEKLGQRFSQFAEEARDYACQLYENLSTQIARDEEVLAIAQEVRRPPEPNVLFATVHFLLMEMPDPHLSRFYGSLCEDPSPAESAYPHFREFLLANRSRAIPLLRTRITQTNEVKRCSYLLPAFSKVHEAAGGCPLALVDIGCSAGLHLLWDHYYYDYGCTQVGDPSAAVTIACELRGSVMPSLPARFPPCAFRLGIDLNPVDLTDPVERRWFEALIWPDHADRRRIGKIAIGELIKHPPRMVRGDAIAVLAGHLRDVPSDTALVVYHSHALHQESSEYVDALGRILAEFSSQRPVYWLVCEGREVNLRTLNGGQIAERRLANKDGHGRWLEWL